MPIGERAGAEGWSHEEFLAVCLQRGVAAGEAHGGEAASARLASRPARAWRSSTTTTPGRSNAEIIGHLATLNFVLAQEERGLSRPTRTGKTHLAIGLGIRACQAGRRVLFATATEWVARQADAHSTGRLQPALVRLAGVRCRGTWFLTSRATM